MSEPTEPRPPTEAPDAPQADGVGPQRRFHRAVTKRHFRRTRAVFGPAVRVLAKIPHPPWQTKRGILLLFVLFAGFGAVATFGGVTAVAFSETPGFCGMCHTMDPELKAYAMSPHKDVACGECHVNPGIGGFVKAKMNGTKQLFGIITGIYPTPIEPPDHVDMPPVKDSCLKCHSLATITENAGPVKLILRARYQSNESNTRETVAVMLRPAGLGDGSGVLGIHWHVQKTVTYTTTDIHSSKIDLVEFKAADGTTKQYIAGSQVTVSTDVRPDIMRLKQGETTKLMDCLDCHNRIGHEILPPDQAVDQAMAAGRISTTLPYIKRDSVALLNGNYATLSAADAAIEGLRATYAAKYPLIAQTQAWKVTAAIDELKAQYRLIATPAMKVNAKTYPDNLGHQASLGCFRCHDGAHYLVVKGQVTTTTIPSACSTCHTFPQISSSASMFPLANNPAAAITPAIASLPLGAKPADHQDKLYVFSHKNAVQSTDPTGTSCASCHTPSYCVNCHSSGAIKVKHDRMLTNHANAAAAAGGTQACAYCHLPVFCQKCHEGPILGNVTQMPAVNAKTVAAIKVKTP
jgi:nitrate/TMAO reductase-like tetraheme cytochrome c subunit